MHAILGLLPERGLRPIGDFVGDLLSSVRGQAMHDDRVAPRSGEQGGVYLVSRRESIDSLLRLGFLAHARPHVRIQDVGLAGRFVRVVREVKMAGGLSSERLCLRHDVALNLVADRRGDGEVGADQRAAENQGVRDVIAIADIGDFHPLELAEALVHCEQVADSLAGVAIVAQSVDHRHRGVPGQVEHVLVAEHTGHDRVDVTAQDAGHVTDRLALAEGDLARREVQSVAAQVQHGHVERYARAQAGLLENHPQRFALQIRGISAPFPVGLERRRQIQQADQLLGSQVGQREKVLHADTPRRNVRR